MAYAAAARVSVVSAEKELPKPPCPTHTAIPERDDMHTGIEMPPQSLQKDFQVPLDQVTSTDLPNSQLQLRQLAFTAGNLPSVKAIRQSRDTPLEKECREYLDTTEEILYSSTLLRGKCFSVYQYMVGRLGRSEG